MCLNWHTANLVYLPWALDLPCVFSLGTRQILCLSYASFVPCVFVQLKAKVVFAVCLKGCTRQTQGHTANVVFVVCQFYAVCFCTVKGKNCVRCVPEMLHTANSRAHGNHTFSGSVSLVRYLKSFQLSIKILQISRREGIWWIWMTTI